MMPSAKPGLSCAKQDSPIPYSSISFGMTLVMAIACGVAAANIYYNQPMLGIMEAAFPGQATVIGLVPTATQLGFAAGLLLLVPLGDRFDRRRLILIQLAALTLSLAAAALAPDAWSLVVSSALVEGHQAWRSRSCLSRRGCRISRHEPRLEIRWLGRCLHFRGSPGRNRLGPACLRSCGREAGSDDPMVSDARG
jgi:hypothetical protein